MNKNTKKALDTKKRIMKTFLDLLEKNTLEEITITEICQYAEIGRPSFYRNFKSKEDVLEYIIVKKLESMLKNIENLEDLVNDVEYFYNVFYPEKAFFVFLQERSLSLFILRALSVYVYYRNYRLDIRNIDIDSFVDSISKEYLYGLSILSYLLMALIELCLSYPNNTKENMIEAMKSLHLSYSPSKDMQKYKQTL